MGIFATKRTTDRLEDRIKTLELQCDGLERARKTLDLEFTELYDKVRHQMSRMAKRDARATEKSANGLDEVPASPASLGSDPVSQSIMLRRGIYGGK